MKNRIRNNLKKVFYSDEEIELLKSKMNEIGTNNFSAYARKMTLDGYIIKQDFTDIKQLIFEINKIGNNINQIAKNVNIDNKISADKMNEIKNLMEEIWHTLKSKI